MSVRDDFFAAKAKGALWDVAVSIKRGNPLPLDADSIFESYEALEAYAADVLAYPGQLVAVVNADSTGIYYLDQNLAIQPVGVIPAGDGKTIDIDENDVISMHDYGKVFYEYVPEEKNETGEVTKEASYARVEVSETKPWKAGLEPKVVTENGKLVIGWFEPNPTTIEGVNDQVTAVQGTVADLEESVGSPSEGDTPATGLYKEVEDVQKDVEELNNQVGTSEDQLGDDVNTLWANVNNLDDRLGTVESDYLKAADKKELQDAIDAIEIPVLGIAADDKVLALGADKLITATVSMEYDETNKAIKLYGKDKVELGSVDATPFIKDGMLHDVDYNAENNTLTFTWNTDAGEAKTDTVVLSDIIEPYTAGDGLELTGNEFKVKLADGSESFLTVSADGVKLTGVAGAIATAKDEAISDAEGKIATAKQEAIDAAATDATTKANQALADAKADAANLYATKEYVGAIPDNYTETNVISYINKKAEETLAAAQGGSSETAASVKQQLDNYKSENDTKVNANTTAITNINNKLTTIEENAEVNIIETVKVNGTALTVTDKAVDVTVPTKLTDLEGWTALDERVTAAKSQADKGVTDAATAQAAADTNAGEIAKHETRIGNLETAKGDHETRIISLENADSQHASEYSALKGIVDGHTEAIAKKAEQTVVDGVSAKASANEAAIATLNDTTIPGINAEVAKKANAADVYTKAEIGTPAEGKTIVKMIEDAQAAATYDDTTIKALIAAEETRAKGVEEDHEDRIAEMETFWAAADDPQGTIDKLAEIVSYIEADKTGALDMAADIKANTDAIAAINNAETGILAQANAHTDEAIAAIFIHNLASNDAVGVVKGNADGVNIVAGEFVSVSTDMLVQGKNELILNGGKATA